MNTVFIAIIYCVQARAFCLADSNDANVQQKRATSKWSPFLFPALSTRHAVWFTTSVRLASLFSHLTALLCGAHFARRLRRLRVYAFRWTAVRVWALGATLSRLTSTAFTRTDILPILLEPSTKTHFFFFFLYPEAVFFLPDESGLVPLHTCTAYPLAYADGYTLYLRLAAAFPRAHNLPITQ